MLCHTYHRGTAAKHTPAVDRRSDRRDVTNPSFLKILRFTPGQHREGNRGGGCLFDLRIYRVNRLKTVIITSKVWVVWRLFRKIIIKMLNMCVIAVHVTSFHYKNLLS